jgi:hypothetical protein
MGKILRLPAMIRVSMILGRKHRTFYVHHQDDEMRRMYNYFIEETGDCYLTRSSYIYYTSLPSSAKGDFINMVWNGAKKLSIDEFIKL